MLALFAVVAVTPAGAAVPDADFYRGKTIRIVVGFDAGGGYDAYARLIARHLGKHLAGNPTFVIQNMPGAGSRVAANWLYNIAPRDGTALGTVVQTTPVDQVLDEPGVKYDAAKFNWIGNPIVDNLVTLSARSTGLQTLEDVKAKGGLICGSSGGGPTLVYPHIVNRILPTDSKVVSGYPGVAAINLAMERGEVNCLNGMAWSSMKATMAQMMKDGKLNVLAQWGTEKNPEISAFAKRDVPLIMEYGKSELDRRTLSFVSSTSAFSRPLLAPPDVPPARVKILRGAFDRTMADPDFRADAQRAGMDIVPIGGAALQALAVTIVQQPPDVLKRARELMN